MPNRILRDLTDSESYNSMSIQAREFFCPRLINKADNFGLLPADPKWLRPACYPFLLDQVREADLQRLISECEKSGLVRRYEVNGKQYMQIVKFRQRLRNQTPQWPAPPWGLNDDGPTADICQTSGRQMTAETELELELDKETEKAPVDLPDPLNASKEFKDLWEDWKKHRKEKRSPLTPTAVKMQLKKLGEMGVERAIRTVKHSMSNGWIGLFEPDSKGRSESKPDGARKIVHGSL